MENFRLQQLPKSERSCSPCEFFSRFAHTDAGEIVGALRLTVYRVPAGIRSIIDALMNHASV
jgi:hypothetical protein